MSRNGRIGLIVAAIVVAVVAFVVASPGDEEEGGEQAARTTSTTAETETETQTETPPPAPPKPEVTRIRVRGGEVVGGPPDINAKNGDVVRIVITADAPDDIHLHGYDIERKVGPGQPARFRVQTNLEGSFEMESHVAEDAGRDPVVARLNVEPR